MTEPTLEETHAMLDRVKADPAATHRGVVLYWLAPLLEKAEAQAREIERLRSALADLRDGARTYYSEADARHYFEGLMGRCLDQADAVLAAAMPAEAQERKTP